MNTTRLVIAVGLLVSTVLSSESSSYVGKSLAVGGQADNADLSKHPPNHENWLGLTLYRCLIEDLSMGSCSFFIGTLQEVVAPPEQQAQSEDRRSLSYSKVSVRVDEWLYGDQHRWAPYLLLDKVPVYDYRGEVWRDVKLKVGNTLLIAFYPPKGESQASLNKIDNYGLVVADENLFPAIRDILANHARYVKHPDEIMDAPRLLNARSDRIFGAYLVRYFMLRGAQTDTEAIALTQLIGNPYINEVGWRFLASSLIGAMSDSDHPISEATRSKVTETLVTAGSSDNAELARSALMVLVTLSDGAHVNIKPFLTAERRRKLIKNYKSLIGPESVEKGQAAFESQVALKSK